MGMMVMMLSVLVVMAKISYAKVMVVEVSRSLKLTL